MAAPDAPLNPSDLPVEAWLNNWLTDSATLAGIVGVGKVYPIFLPAATSLPGIVTKRMGTQRPYHMRGQGESATAVFRIECQAKSTREGYLTNARAAKAIRDLVSGLQSDIADQVAGYHFLERVMLTSEYDEEDGSEFGDEAVRHTRVIEIEVAYLETVRDLIGGA